MSSAHRSAHRGSAAAARHQPQHQRNHPHGGGGIGGALAYISGGSSAASLGGVINIIIGGGIGIGGLSSAQLVSARRSRQLAWRSAIKRRPRRRSARGSSALAQLVARSWRSAHHLGWRA